MPNYENGKIYCLRSHQTDDVYYGSTTQKLAVRKGGHKGSYKRWVAGKGKYMTSFELLKYDDCYIELVELYPCKCREELGRREGEIIRDNECINKNITGRTAKEWRLVNADKIKEKQNLLYKSGYFKEYRLVNADKIKEHRLANVEKKIVYDKAYYLANVDKKKGYYLDNIDKIKARMKVKITCICGSVIQKSSKTAHSKTRKHRIYVKENPDSE